jgi:putative phosphoribosyl transferase
LSSLNRGPRRGRSIHHIVIEIPLMRREESACWVAAPNPWGDLMIPEGATRLVLVAHPGVDGCGHPGHRFMGDVLHANAVATLSFGLQSSDERARGVALPAAGEIVARLRGILAWVAAHAATKDLPVAFMAVNDAAALCARAAREPGLGAIRSLVLLDGQLDLREQELAAWRLPTLCIAGRHGVARSGQPLAGARSLPAPHRLVKLATQTQACARSGAYEAMACEVVAWLQQSLPQARWHGHGEGVVVHADPPPLHSGVLESAQ